MQLALKIEPAFIPHLSKKLKHLKRQQEKYNGLPPKERRRLKKKQQAEQKNANGKALQEAKALVKAKLFKIQAESRGRRKLCLLVYDSGADSHFPTEKL